METSSGAFCHKTLFNQSAGREIAEARPQTRPLPARCNDSPVKLAPITRLSANAMTLQQFSLCGREREREKAGQEQRGREGEREARRIIDVMLLFLLPRLRKSSSFELLARSSVIRGPKSERLGRDDRLLRTHRMKRLILT